jgi:hypothetical protein
VYFHFSALALRGPGIRNVLEAAGEKNLLLDVVPLDVERSRIECQAVIEP